ncbi:hypothetical protein [Hymenobacter perfusus]|uniref:Uncharacterized protein n=1 Tax=Hymenobacter perfusus TaxID=1236770 RepID=A0A3R9MJB9_9BACT|nr:hypothetical protein [Hymenobacter perfusus]RSK43588.1 hypothetical protein EI293_11930 [Hymenobacter perfusus]
MEKASKRWLISRMKTSGSKRRYVASGDYADHRREKQPSSFEELPQKEPFQRPSQFYNGKINYDLLRRFLRGQVGQHWNVVHAEILARIPTRLLHYREMIHWYVADQVELLDGKIWNKRTQRFISLERLRQAVTEESTEFYVHPETGLLMRSRP